MSEPFQGEVKPFAFNFAPKYWARCDGQLLSIQQNLSLFSVLGTRFGGNGSTTFALPDLQGRVPIHRGDDNPVGQPGGSAAVTLTPATLPNHQHAAMASSVDADAPVPTGSVLGRVSDTYTQPRSLTELTAGTIGSAGEGRPHENRQPYLALNFCIALAGVFPGEDEEAVA